MTSRTASRLPALDGVRGVAALTVLVSHAANEGMLPAFLGYGAGQMAVGLFFILSGFLMTYLYAHRPIATVPEYALHRFARVVPLYIALVLISIAVQSRIIWTFPIDSWRSIAEHLLFIHGVNTLWTIPVEIHFYFLFALIWMAPRKMIPLLILLQALSAVALFVLGASVHTLPFWLHFFLYGSLCGFAWRRSSEEYVRRAERYQWVGWPILALAVLALPGIREQLGIPVLPVFLDPITIGAVVLLFTGSLLGLGPLRKFAAGWARWLGKVSYGVYLIHFPVLMTLKDVPLPGVVLFLLIVATTLILSALSFGLFEEPLRRRLTARYSEPRPAGTLVTPAPP